MTGEFQNNTGDAARQAARAALRRRLLDWRSCLAADEHAACSARIVAHLLAVTALDGEIPLLAGQVLAFCWPVQAEADLLPAVPVWRARGLRLALPLVIAPAKPLAFREWLPDGELQPDRYGIPTPVAGDLLTPDLLLLPVNAFDAAGYRLGYGGGFFDRTLAALQPRPPAIGVGFEGCRVASILPEAHDQRLDAVVTEAGFWRP